MESQRSVNTQRTLSKQEEIDEDDEVELNKSSSEESQSAQDDAPPSNNTPSIHRSRSQSKVKLLVRSHAVREETSPPPEAGGAGSDCELEEQQQPTRVRHKLRREGSSQSSIDQSWSQHTPTLSRGNSREQYDGANPIDLHQFIVDTLNRNHKDRMLLFKIENELINLSKDSKRSTHKFGQMSSYQRMLVHRVAAYFGMEHNVDPSGMSVIVNTTKNTRLPDRRFRDFVREDLLEEPRRSILKRDSSSFDETGSFKNGERMFNGESRRSKSFEEREEEYEKVRRRIFNHEHLTDAEIECMEEYHWEEEGACPTCSHSHNDRSVRLLKVESYESGDTLKANSLRLQVAKSHSFNGYDQGTTNSHQTQRILTKQDSGSSMSSRISPSSSGYKSQRSDATLSATPSPSATPSLHTQLSGQSGGGMSPEPADTPVVWAVTDMASVPPGSMLIHPQTGQPYTNADGSIYHYDPSNPPQCMGGGGSSGAGDTATSVKPGERQVVYAYMKSECVESVVSSSHADKEQRVGLEGGGHHHHVSYPGTAAPVYPAYTQPPPPQHHLPLVIPPHPPDQYHPPLQLYPAPPPPPPPPIPHHCDPRIPDGNVVNSELSACMMGMSLDTRIDRQQQVMYWQPHHLQSGVYYSSGNTGGAGPAQPIANTARYHQPVPPTFSQLVPHHPPPPIDHTGSCYSGGGYTAGGATTECIQPYPPTLHMYYPPCTNMSGQAGGQPSGYYSNIAGGACAGAPPLVAPPTIPYQQPCTHPTPPHTPQSVCGQLTVYNGCYPGSGHYTPSSTAIGMPQLFRKPSLQVGVRCNSPLRAGGYPPSPSLKDRAMEESKAIQQTLPPAAVYGIRVLPAGEMRLFGNTGRLPFALPAAKPINRKHKFRVAGMNTSRPNEVVTQSNTSLPQADLAKA